MSRQSGFTLLELMIVIAIIGIMAGFAVPNYLSWIPKYRLKSAADELYHSMMMARMTAIKENTTCSVTATASPDRYVIATAAKTIKTIDLSNYGSGVCFKHPEGSTPVPASPIDFNSRGLRDPPSSYVYLSNEHGSDYWRVGALSSGVIKLQRRKGTDWQ